jgi:hypothetical protein
LRFIYPTRLYAALFLFAFLMRPAFPSPSPQPPSLSHLGLSYIDLSHTSLSHIDLSHAVVLAPSDADGPETAALQLLLDEAAKRTGETWQVQTYTPKSTAACGTCILIGREDQLRAAPFAHPVAAWPSALEKPEAFRVDTVNTADSKAGHIVRIAGQDDRGTLFGIGYLLRHIRFAPGQAVLPAPMNVVTAPRFAVRGHQLGYRFKNNTYDAWTPQQFEQYIRDVAVFGANTIELLPPRTDDAPSSPLFPQPAMQTMTRVSGILKKYGLRCSVFYPAMAQNYADPATVASELRAWGDVFRQLPQIDDVFIPGGDPGHTDPAVLFPFLAQVAAVLHQSHPQAGIWVSAQGFNAAAMQRFYALVSARPAWLAGIVVGPQSRDSLIVQRAHIPAPIPIRFYPDIAHTMHSQFPVPEWDEAYALTEGREVIDPRPMAETAIFHHYASSMNGFVAYSEGVNDDVNKFIWTALGWSPGADPAETLEEYARYFLGDQGIRADDFAQGILSLERNWSGPLAANAGVDQTLRQFQQMQSEATLAQAANWRFQGSLYRAYTDAYERRRLIAAGAQQQRALNALADAPRTGSIQAIENAAAALTPDPAEAAALHPARDTIETLAGQLFKNIGLQLSVAKYGASATDRGASLDTLDISLNDREWLNRQFAHIRTLGSEPERLQAIAAIVNWRNPGPGSFYDDLGDPSAEPHLVRGPGYPTDPAFFRTALDGVAGHTPDQGWRLSEISHAGRLYEGALELRYTGLSASARYKLRIDYAGEDSTQLITLTANGGVIIHGPRLRATNPEFVEFEIPAAATRRGVLDLRWTQLRGLGGGGRGLQIAEVWLIRLPGSASK